MLESLLTSFTLGLLATANPCVLPLYPGFLAYLSGQEPVGRARPWLGLFVLLGVLTMMLALGGLIAGLALSLGRVFAVVIPVADVVLLGLGILLILNLNPFKALPLVAGPGGRHPLAQAFGYGLLYGPLTLPCSGPLVVALFAYSFTWAEVVSKLGIFIGFGLGFGLPLLLLSLVSEVGQRQITRWFAQRTRWVNLLGGVLLLGVGLYDLASNWALLQLYWSW